MKAFLLLAVFGLTTAVSQIKLSVKTGIQDSTTNSAKEVLYLPNGTALEALSLGYRNFLADILWFNTVSYFGKHYKTDRDYTWLYHMCDLVTTLDPRAQHVYQFAANMLSWEARKPEKSIAILNKAINNFPHDWLYYYLRGFTQMYFLKDIAAAKEDFTTSAQQPQAPALIARLAAKLAVSQDDPEIVKQFLRNMIRNTSDPNARKALIQRLTEIENKGVLKLPEKILK